MIADSGLIKVVAEGNPTHEHGWKCAPLALDFPVNECRCMGCGRIEICLANPLAELLTEQKRQELEEHLHQMELLRRYSRLPPPDPAQEARTRRMLENPKGWPDHPSLRLKQEGGGEIKRATANADHPTTLYYDNGGFCVFRDVTALLSNGWVIDDSPAKKAPSFRKRATVQPIPTTRCRYSPDLVGRFNYMVEVLSNEDSWLKGQSSDRDRNKMSLKEALHKYLCPSPMIETIVEEIHRQYPGRYDGDQTLLKFNDDPFITHDKIMKVLQAAQKIIRGQESYDTSHGIA